MPTEEPCVDWNSLAMAALHAWRGARAVWWSARSLACSRRAWVAKVGLLGRFARESDLVVVCQARGNSERLRRELRHMEKEFVFYLTMCAREIAGGLLMFARRDVADALSACMEVIVLGRVGLLRVRWPGGGSLQCVGVHSDGMHAKAQTRVMGVLRAGRAEATASPRCTCALAGGDWNFQSLGDGSRVRRCGCLCTSAPVSGGWAQSSRRRASCTRAGGPIAGCRSRGSTGAWPRGRTRLVAGAGGGVGGRLRCRSNCRYSAATSTRSMRPRTRRSRMPGGRSTVGTRRKTRFGRSHKSPATSFWRSTTQTPPAPTVPTEA